MSNTSKRLITEADAARYLSCSRSFLRQSRLNGNLPGRSAGPPWVRLGRRGIRYDLNDLDAWLEARKSHPKPWPGAGVDNISLSCGAVSAAYPNHTLAAVADQAHEVAVTGVRTQRSAYKGDSRS